MGVSVRITMPSAAGMAHDAIGLGERSISTRHMRQLPAMFRRGWKQKIGISLPAASHAWSTVEPAGTSISTPSMVSLGIQRSLSISRRPLQPGLLDAALQLRAEMADQALHRPGGGIAQRADGVAFDLLGDVVQKVDLGELGPALADPGQHAPQPARTLAARRALAARLVHVEAGQARDCRDDV